MLNNFFKAAADASSCCRVRNVEIAAEKSLRSGSNNKMDIRQTPTSPADSQQDFKLRSEIRERTLGYMLTAFGLVAGLAWNDAIQTLIAYLYPLPENTLPAKFMYAIIISIVVVVVSVSVSRLFHRLQK